MAGPQDEFARQRALDTYRIIDTPPDAAFDDIARLASALCDAPVALVSLIDRDRQWFKARQAGSPEMIVVLHGNHTAAGLQKLRDRVHHIERDTGFRLLSASADSATPQERVEMVFLRADEALTRAKDAARGRAAA